MNTTLFYNIIMGNISTLNLDYSYIGYGAFAECKILTDANFSQCTIIKSNAFQSCPNLISISFPECTLIENQAFYGCSNLSTVSFPKCTSIGSSAFQYCRGLTTISFPKCEQIGSFAFQTCSNLTIVSFPKCTNIGSQAFWQCINLSKIYLMESSVVTINNSNAFYSTPISLSSYLGYFGSIYVPTSLLTSYKSALYWSAYSARIVGF